MKTLVAYFSASGTTEGVAKKVAEAAEQICSRSNQKYHIQMQI